METVTKKDAKKLSMDPVSFAIMMDCNQLESVIVTFVSVLIRRKTNPRWSELKTEY